MQAMSEDKKDSTMEKGLAFMPFSLPDQTGSMRSLTEYAGKWLVLYFYSKDNTSGCTLEARDFASLADDFAAENAVVVGVSRDSVKSHASFAAKQSLNITLLSDPERQLLEAAGVWQKKKLYGKEHMGVVRSTALVDPQGVIREVWTRVKVAGHAKEVLDRLRELRNQV